MIYIGFKLLFALHLLFIFLTLRFFHDIYDLTIPLEVIMKSYKYSLTLDQLSALSYLLTLISLLLFLWLFEKPKINSNNIYLVKEFRRASYHFYSMMFDLICSPNWVQVYIIKLAKMILDYGRISAYIIYAAVIFPRLIIICCLFIAVYFCKYYIYYYSLLLLIIPLIINIFLYILKNLEFKFLPELKLMLIFTTEQIKIKNLVTGKEELKPQHTVSFIAEYAEFNVSEFWNNVYLPVSIISKFLQNKVLFQYNKIRVFTQLVYFYAHVLLWGYFLVDFLGVFTLLVFLPCFLFYYIFNDSDSI